MEEYGTTYDRNVDEAMNVVLVMKTMRASEDSSFIRYSTFGELIIKAEDPYAIRKFEIAKSGAALYFQQSLFEAVKKEEIDRGYLNKINLGLNFADGQAELQALCTRFGGSSRYSPPNRSPIANDNQGGHHENSVPVCSIHQGQE